MATRRSGTTSSPTKATNAGKPVLPGPARGARTARDAGQPSPEDLDLRDRLKAGPRRQAGPPLVGDTLSRAAMDALRDEVVPAPTDPKNRRSRS